jgi:hypothetical protein
MATKPALEFRYVFDPGSREHSLDAYDASQALYGIARSLSIASHYAVNGKVIKQAPSLKGASVRVLPPNAGSFEVIVPVLLMAASPDVIATVSQNVFSNFLTDIIRHSYRRLVGQPSPPETDELRETLHLRPGDVDAMADAMEEDVNRIHRPIAKSNADQYNINIFGNNNKIVVLNRDTHEFAKTKIPSSHQSNYFGHITSLNTNTMQGRFFVENEERNIGFSFEKGVKPSAAQRKLMASSLNEWVSEMRGFLWLEGYPLKSKSGILKHLFVTSVERG